MSGVAVITEACIGTKVRACVDMCPVQCIYEFDPTNIVLVSDVEAGDGQIAKTRTPYPDGKVADGTPTSNYNAVVPRQCGHVVVVHDRGAL